MLSVGLLFKAPLGQTWEMLSFYNYNLAKIHFYWMRFKIFNEILLFQLFYAFGFNSTLIHLNYSLCLKNQV